MVSVEIELLELTENIASLPMELLPKLVVTQLPTITSPLTRESEFDPLEVEVQMVSERSLVPVTIP